MRSGNIVTVVHWFHRLRGPAPGWTGSLLLVALLAAAGSGEAVSLSPGDILIANSGGNDIVV